jgi:hypothetical protein
MPKLDGDDEVLEAHEEQTSMEGQSCDRWCGSVDELGDIDIRGIIGSAITHEDTVGVLC